MSKIKIVGPVSGEDIKKNSYNPPPKNENVKPEYTPPPPPANNSDSGSKKGNK